MPSREYRQTLDTCHELWVHGWSPEENQHRLLRKHASIQGAVMRVGDEARRVQDDLMHRTCVIDPRKYPGVSLQIILFARTLPSHPSPLSLICGCVPQYSSGNSSVVADRSASVTT